MAYYLAIDSGGTKAEFLLADDTRELKRTCSGTIRPVNADTEIARQNIADALAELERATRVRIAQLDCACIGTSGNTVPMVADFLTEEFSHHFGGKLLILNDVEIALDSAFQGRSGVLVLAGTGSNLAVRASNGAIFTMGGWGPNLGDQGSGHWIGLEGLRRGFLAHDTGRSSRLVESARRFFQLPNIDALIEFANAQHPVRYASRFAPEVVFLAEQGDEVAIEILEQGGRDLAHLAGLVIERMKPIEAQTFTPPPVAVTGGILTHVERLRRSMCQALRERYPAIEFLDTPVDPVRGALWRAIRGN